MEMKVIYNEKNPTEKVHTRVVRVRSSIHPSESGYQQLAGIRFQSQDSDDEGTGPAEVGDDVEFDYCRFMEQKYGRRDCARRVRSADMNRRHSEMPTRPLLPYAPPQRPLKPPSPPSFNTLPETLNISDLAPSHELRNDSIIPSRQYRSASTGYENLSYEEDEPSQRNRSELDGRELFEHSEFPLYPAMIEAEDGYFKTLLWRHKHPVIVYCLVFWTFGLCVSFLGPTLWDLGCQTGTGLSTMTWVFFSQSLFILIGSIFGGILVQQFSSTGVLLFSMVGICCSLMGVAVSSNMPALAFTLAVMGFCMGLVDTTANVSLLTLFGVDVSPFMQALHFFYGLGAVLSPLIAEPFLLSFDCTLLIQGNSSAHGVIEEMMIKELQHDKSAAKLLPQTLEEAQDRLSVQDVFWVLAFLQIPVILAVLTLLRSQSSPQNKPKVEDKYENLDNKAGKAESSENLFTRCWVNSTCNYKTVIIFASILLFCSDGVQSAFGGLIFSYGRIDVEEITGNEGAYLNAGFWGMFALGRFIAIFAALYLSPGLILFMDLCGALGALTIFWLFPHGHLALYVGTCAYGLFLSSISPATFSLTEQFVEIGPSATSFLVVSASAGEMIYPVLIGHLFDSFGPESFVWGVSLSQILAVLMFSSLWVLGLREKKPDQGLKDIIRQLFPCCSKRGAENDPILQDPAYKRFSQPPTPGEGDGKSNGT